MEAKTLSLEGGLKEGLNDESRCKVKGSWEREQWAQEPG